MQLMILFYAFFVTSSAAWLLSIIEQEPSIILKHLPFQWFKHLRLCSSPMRDEVRKYMDSKTFIVMYSDDLNAAFLNNDVNEFERILPVGNFYKLDFQIIDRSLRGSDKEYAKNPMNYAFLKCSSPIIRALMARGCEPKSKDMPLLQYCLRTATNDGFEKFRICYELRLALVSGSKDLYETMKGALFGSKTHYNLICRAVEWNDTILLWKLKDGIHLNLFINYRDHLGLTPIFYCNSAECADKLIDVAPDFTVVSPMGLNVMQHLRMLEKMNPDQGRRDAIRLFEMHIAIQPEERKPTVNLLDYFFS